MNEILLTGTFRRFMGKMILNNLMLFVGSVANGIVISRFLGIESMAAYQITMPLYFAVMMFSQIISLGVQNNCAKSLGSGKIEDARAYYSVALIAALPFAFILSAIIFFKAEFFAALLGAKGSAAGLLTGAADYLSGASVGFFILLILPMQISLIFLEGRAKIATHSIIVMTAVNILGVLANALYLNGGMFGMGLVMSLSALSSFVVIEAGILQKPGQIRFELSGFYKNTDNDPKNEQKNPFFHKLYDVLRIGLPSAIDRFYKSTQMLVINFILIAVAPKAAISAFADINALNNVFNPIVMGLSATTLTMAGVFTGERDKLSINYLLRIATKHAFLIGLFTATVTIVAAPLLIGLFVKEPGENFDTAVTALRIFICYLPIYAVNNVLQKYYLGVNAMKMTYLTSFFDNLLFICALAVILGHTFGAVGVWAAFPLAEILTALALVVIIAIQKKGIPRSASDFLFLPKTLTDYDAPTLVKSAANMDEIAQASEETRQFLISNGASGKTAMVTALAVEEMGGNIIRWGFDGKKNYSIDILVIREEKNWILRIRDDCKPFDPNKWLEIHKADDPLKNIGIRSVCAISKDARYSRTLGLNYLIIRFGED